MLNNPDKNDTGISPEMHNRGIELPTGPKQKSEEELFDEFGRYIIEDYDALPPFSDFLPVSQRRISVLPFPVLTCLLILRILLLQYVSFVVSGSGRDIRETSLVLLR